MSLPEARARLAAQQAEVLRALTGQAPPPADFDEARLGATADALVSKRAQAVARAWPGLAAGLGERFRERFDYFAKHWPLPHEGGPLADGRTFARMLARLGELSDDGRREALAVDIHFKMSERGLVPRRGPAVSWTLLRQPHRLVVAVRLGWLGEHWFTIPLAEKEPATGPLRVPGPTRGE
jgi:hypothetical protein